ncbi:MAG: hypothetical protein EBZ74_07365 [Planctomycetia bacterium]|nr:hypothetical protein [Planctomycetia bacterium]
MGFETVVCGDLSHGSPQKKSFAVWGGPIVLKAASEIGAAHHDALAGRRWRRRRWWHLCGDDAGGVRFHSAAQLDPQTAMPVSEEGGQLVIVHLPNFVPLPPVPVNQIGHAIPPTRILGVKTCLDQPDQTYHFGLLVRGEVCRFKAREV